MISYLDRTFCISDKCTCGRKLTPDIIRAAKEWWGGEDAPISVADFCSVMEKEGDEDE